MTLNSCKGKNQVKRWILTVKPKVTVTAPSIQSKATSLQLHQTIPGKKNGYDDHDDNHGDHDDDNHVDHDYDDDDNDDHDDHDDDDKLLYFFSSLTRFFSIDLFFSLSDIFL